MKLGNASQEAIREAFDGLEGIYGHVFRTKFKSITLDNGVEFLDWRSLEISIHGRKERRTTIFFAYAYSAWERGKNENHNRMIRRFIPKGTNILDLTHEQIKEIQDWMNNYPRRILGYKTPRQVAYEQLQSSQFDLKDKICRN